MRIRSFVTVIVGLTFVRSLAGQGSVEPKRWVPPLAADGHPDLQGTWVNRSATPLQRPKDLEGREFLTDAEVQQLKQRADRLFNSGQSDMPAGDDVFLAAWADLKEYKRSSATGTSDIMLEREFDNRTALIIDPPNGKLPANTPESLRRQSEAAKSIHRPPTSIEDLSNLERCITFGVPMPRPGPFTSYYQIVQTSQYVVVMLEAIHDARIIPLDGRPHLPPEMRTWNGDSRGHWEGQTLVVDTTNFSPRTNFMGSAENLHLIERFSRVAPDELRYEITVGDPTTWTRPWTAALRLKESKERIYEMACHEGNLEIMEDMLRVPRHAAEGK
jgi:hypothetical protein